MKKLFLNLIYPIAVVVIVLFVWYLASIWIDVDLILPTPYQAFKNVGYYLKDSSFWISLGWTYLRSLLGFLLGFVLALSLSALAYAFAEVERLINPLMAFIRAIPTMAIILILIVSLSVTFIPIVVAVIVICPTLYQSFLSSFKQIDEKLIEMSTIYKVPKKKQIMGLYIPTILPSIFQNSASGFSLNIKLIIAAEALAQTRNSIGRLMQYAKINIEIEKLFALTIIAVIVSVISEAGIKLLAKVVIRHGSVK